MNRMKMKSEWIYGDRKSGITITLNSVIPSNDEKWINPNGFIRGAYCGAPRANAFIRNYLVSYRDNEMGGLVKFGLLFDHQRNSLKTTHYHLTQPPLVKNWDKKVRATRTGPWSRDFLWKGANLIVRRKGPAARPGLGVKQ